MLLYRQKPPHVPHPMVEAVLALIKQFPEEWETDNQYYFFHPKSRVMVWKENRPFADMTIHMSKRDDFPEDDKSLPTLGVRRSFVYIPPYHSGTFFPCDKDRALLRCCFDRLDELKAEKVWKKLADQINTETNRRLNDPD